MTAVWLIALAACAGAALHLLQSRLQRHQGRRDELVERINARLPQLQCGDCDYPGCRPYAEAIADQQAGIEQCPPGGAETAKRLADLLNQPPPPMADAPAQVARIREEDCVGCALCLPVCPTDAIIGAAQHSHIVISDDCVGCALCLPPCPMDCIDMVPARRPLAPLVPIHPVRA